MEENGEGRVWLAHLSEGTQVRVGARVVVVGGLVFMPLSETV